MKNIVKYSKLLSLPLLLSACGGDNQDEQVKQASPNNQKISDAQIIVADFEQAIPTWLTSDNAITTLVNGQGVSSGNTALKIDFDASEQMSSITMQPEQTWDWSNIGDFNLAADITNPGDVSVHLYIVVRDKSGAMHRRSVSIPAHSSATYYAELKGPQLEFDSGLREDPPAWNSTDVKMFWQTGRKKIQLEQVKSITYNVEMMNQDKSLIIDNIRLRNNPEIDPNYLVGIADKFGQNAKIEFPNKIHSEAELKALADKEIAQLNAEGPMADRSKFGGWKSGPKLEATGYFRTEKVDGKWAMVDPEGYLFFSSALANIRIANTTTTTGVDFKDDSVRYIDPNDVTPEDSLGIRPVSKAAQKTRYVSSDVRHNLFTWLPSYDDDLANHYSYRRSVHRGPIHHGETFSFYQANLERRYGETHPDSYNETWRDITIKRFKNWGFTSTGNWTDAEFYQMNQIPYFANGWIIGDFKKISSGNDVWSKMPDPFDPEFKKRAEITTQVIAEEVKNNPWCIGVFIDNEKSWGNVKTTRGHYGIVIHTLSVDEADSPTKHEFIRLLKEKYASVTALNSAWNSTIDSWETLSNSYTVGELTDEMVGDFSMLLEAYATKYFKTVHDALEKVLPNHMYMGVRMAHWGKTPEAIKAAKKYVDVMSYNFYREGLHEKAWGFLAEADMPSIIGEYHIGATSDTGLFHPGLILASDQNDRARMYKEYMRMVVDNPYFVGAHWFQYLDSPLTGRAYDGENYNTGFVTITDVPYKTMVDAAKEINEELYPRRFGKR
ncbi:beta-galactosidase [Thalassotalea sp. PLHSN55]|uniref:beta-galactosidase n=1 Tax=Thalassotalea sp. PLHSN55 TaxID=3435888 RepID=UPI003F861FF6